MRHVGTPVAPGRYVAMLSLGHRAAKEDSRYHPAVGEHDGTAIEPARLARLDAVPNIVGDPVELARDGDAVALDLEHARVDVADRVQAVSRRGASLLDELGALEILVQLQAAHERA